MKKILFKIVCVTFFLLTYSCTDAIDENNIEETDTLTSRLQNYPEKITNENWEEFVYAPKDVIDYHIKLENKLLSKKLSNIDAIVLETPCSSDYNTFGVVRAMIDDQNTTNIDGIQVDGYFPLLEILNFSTLTEATLDENINWCSQDIPSGGGGNGFLVCYSLGDVDDAYELEDWRNGVTQIDLILIQRHILGVEVFENVHNLIAADANRDGRISVIDLLALQSIILGINNNIPYEPDRWQDGNGPWVFIGEEELEFAQEYYSNPDDEFDMSNPVFLQLEGSCKSEIPLDIIYNLPVDFGSIIGIKLGDVNYSRNLIDLYN